MNPRECLTLQTLVPPVVKNNGPVGGGQIKPMGTTADRYELELCQLVVPMEDIEALTIDEIVLTMTLISGTP